MKYKVTNRLTIKADSQTVEHILQNLNGSTSHEGSSFYIDFNKIVQAPENLVERSDELGNIGMDYLLVNSKLGNNKHCRSIYPITRLQMMKKRYKKEALATGRQYLHNIADYGFTNLYDWKMGNWGTECNAFNQRFEAPNTLYFDTIDTHVFDLMKKVSTRYPEVEFYYAYAGEIMGTYTGVGKIKSGKGNIKCLEDDTIASYELAFELNPERRKDYELIDGEFRFIYKWG